MEKQHQQAAKPKNKILKFLPKAASAVSFQNPPFSPGRDKRIPEYHQHFHNRVKSHVGKGYSGPIVSIIPDEARRRTSKNGSFENHEPTSPKISCMGQIKHKKKIINSSSKNKAKNQETEPEKSTSTSTPRREIKKHALTIKRMFSNAVKVPEHGRRRSDASMYDKPPLTDTSHRAPALSQLKRFASGRDTFANFDWTSQVVPAESDHRNYYSDDEEEERHSDHDYDEDVIIPFSAPIIVGPGVGNLQPRKEVNLWRRRTMNPPKPLQLNVMVRTT
ncbi:uncharacterized protein At1g76070 [Ricinus communis]|uniref:Syringolide-induced protein 14-1-1 n=1 Tax=Ricinus communis TaxID=3988 RepID=B9R8F5_RICCO|nr:uncharacterized protein At1g76070 [Ricinus communis]EEF52785.1 conserved hypothetical protein [Ricinus communis]|eukprot:XP_002510598.1 uncharacterized protein At1g76070 [Ricinus communis]